MINRVGEFEKVSFEQFYEAMKEVVEDVLGKISDETIILENVKGIYDRLKLPARATSGSAGYDFAATFDFTLPPNHTVKIPTGIRVKTEEGWWLGALPRSGLGFKYRVQLDNTLGVIDSDYYYSDNEGHIFLKMTNDSLTGKTLEVKEGDKIAQAIFIPFGITYDDNATGVRNGGMGSTSAPR